VWVDEEGAYRGFRATHTDYRAQGPCLADVRYLEETAGGEIAARIDVSLARSDDYLRAFHHIRYDVRRPVRWQRLAFYQLGADFYNDTPARRGRRRRPGIARGMDAATVRPSTCRATIASRCVLNLALSPTGPIDRVT